MRGYFDSRAWLKTKTPSIAHPETIRHITLGEFQGNNSPPKFNPSNGIERAPIMAILPNQSTALIPSIKGVRGLWTSRKSNSRMKDVPATGRLIQNIHLHETYWVNAPPRTGPTPPATAQIACKNPRYNALCLYLVLAELSLT